MLLGLRVAPVFAFAPPFSLLKLPLLFRLLLGLGLAASLTAASSPGRFVSEVSLSWLVPAALRELLLGVLIVLTFQLVFAALYFAGRTIDVQAGFGLALLIDPTSRAQMPLVGTLFAYGAAALFFAFDGHLDLLRIISASLEAFPIGQWVMPASLDRLAAFMSAAFLAAFGVAGASIGILFMIDLTIALLVRTVPQMNALLLGLQIKAVVLLLVLPVSFALGGMVLLRMMRMILEAIPRLM